MVTYVDATKKTAWHVDGYCHILFVPYERELPVLIGRHRKCPNERPTAPHIGQHLQ